MAQKEASVAELTKNFEDSTSVLLTEYRGLTVAELKELRNTIRQDAEYAVVKNTLTKIAARSAGVEGLDDELKGPSAIAFVHGDPVAVAKGLRAFAKAHPLLVIKGGYFNNADFSGANLDRIKLEPARVGDHALPDFRNAKIPLRYTALFRDKVQNFSTIRWCN